MNEVELGRVRVRACAGRGALAKKLVALGP